MTDSRYIVGLFPHIETANIPENKTTIFSLLFGLQKEIKHRDKKYFVGHIRAHSGLPGPLHEGNALADALTNVIALHLYKNLIRPKVLTKFTIKIHLVQGINFISRPDVLLTGGRGYICIFLQDTDSPIWILDRLICHVTFPKDQVRGMHTRSPRPPASSRLRFPHPPCCTTRPRAKKFVSERQRGKRTHEVPSRPAQPRQQEGNVLSPSGGG